jgi:hypothetical protein
MDEIIVRIKNIMCFFIKKNTRENTKEQRIIILLKV